MSEIVVNDFFTFIPSVFACGEVVRCAASNIVVMGASKMQLSISINT